MHAHVVTLQCFIESIMFEPKKFLSSLDLLVRLPLGNMNVGLKLCLKLCLDIFFSKNPTFTIVKQQKTKKIKGNKLDKITLKVLGSVGLYVFALVGRIKKKFSPTLEFETQIYQHSVFDQNGFSIFFLKLTRKMERICIR